MDLRPRTLLQRLNDAVTPDDPADDEPDDQDPEPDPAPTVPAQPQALRVGDRAPNWWDPKPVIVADDPDDDDAARRRAAAGSIKWINGVPHHVPPPEPVKDCEHPNPHAVRAQPSDQLVAYWCEDCETQLPVPDDYDELDDVEKEDNEDGEDEEGEDGVPAAIRRRWSLRGSGQKTYARPGYLKAKPAPKQSLVGWWTGRSTQSRWLLYNGAALAGGFALGVPQFFTAEVAYLDATYDSWTEFYVVIWYGVALGIWMWDYRTRRWLPPFALVARIPLISMIVGSLLYGTPSLPA
ncbi:hypothetical protein [Streptomyces sp. A5-4]|uniref:hypothetical protein n=1 Tax=Streptomyces sp. A5-4 TaxID=3384771 RepID=UPI003DA9B5CA